MPRVDLDTETWNKVMGLIAQAPWHIANPLLMEIGEQLKRQTLGNSGETPAAEAQVSGKRHS